MNNNTLIKSGLIQRAQRALVYGHIERAFQYLRWARELK